jgi:hypothetical protein
MAPPHTLVRFLTEWSPYRRLGKANLTREPEKDAQGCEAELTSTIFSFAFPIGPIKGG